MDTLLIKIANTKKVNSLVQILKSLDFVVSVDRFDKYLMAKKIFEDINTESAGKGLSQISESEIHKAVKSYRSGK